jgi:hypothetical protein
MVRFVLHSQKADYDISPDCAAYRNQTFVNAMPFQKSYAFEGR